MECSDYANLQQHGCNVSADGGMPQYFTLPVACALPKKVAVQVSCGGGTRCKEASLPPFVRRVTNAYGRGKLGTFDATPLSVAQDPRALKSPTGGARAIGKLVRAALLCPALLVPRAHAQHSTLRIRLQEESCPFKLDMPRSR